MAYYDTDKIDQRYQHKECDHVSLCSATMLSLVRLINPYRITCRSTGPAQRAW
jgi:hypothetical protein